MLTRGIRSVFELPIYEYEAPLKHLQNMICDTSYEEKWCRILGIGHCGVYIYRTLIRGMLSIRYSGFRSTLKAVHTKLKKHQSTISDRNG